MKEVVKCFLLLLIYFSASVAYTQTEEEIRQAYLEELIRLQDNPSSFDDFVGHHDKTWYDWAKRTGELPPNFESLPSIPFLPDPLVMDEGGKDIPVESLAQWKEQREYLKQQVKHIFSGTFPPPPEDLKINVLEERRNDHGVKIQMIELRFGENDHAKLTLEVFTPPGKGPFPVFMTQWNHRGWAQIAVRRGYLGVVYAGADAKDDTREYLELYPDYDWSTLMARAWGAQRAVDYLHTLDEVDKSKIAITGHSRNAKQSLLAAAFDDRITAVISSSGGTGGEFPYRYTDERHSNESIEFLYSRRTHWAHPRIRFYVGREHKLPIDQNSLMALIAPRALLLSSSIREGGGGDPWAIEQLFRSLSKVYNFLGAPEKLGIRLRDGEHAVEARDLEAYLDWLDIRFKRKNIPWKNKLFYGYSFDKWKSLSKEKIDLRSFPDISPNQSMLTNSAGKKIRTVHEWKQKRNRIIQQIEWVLGDEPAGVEASKIAALTSKEDYVESFLNRPRVKNGKKMNIAPYNAFGDYIHGSLYYPTDQNGEMLTGESGKIPVVIYLHKFSNTGYDSQLTELFEKILSKGIAVFAFDLVGYGTRMEEGAFFYERYPNWSKLGKMVRDTQAAVDALEGLEFIDNNKIFISGYSLGGTVGLFTAALDRRIAGTAVSSAFTPLRIAPKDVEGVKAYSHLYGLLPRLGFFVGNESKIPVDFPEIISVIAPRPLLVISPELDRHADLKQVTDGIQEVASVYSLFDASKNLQFKTPHEFNKFTSSQQTELLDWLEEMTE